MVDNLHYLHAILATLNQIRYDYELIAVVDGKKVDRSYQLAKSIKDQHLQVVGYQNNYGKGYALRFGMAHTRGDYVAFIDAGMEIDPNGISMILEHMEWYNADIIVASKRQIISRVLLGIKVRDTQAGLKIFRRPVLEKVLPRLLVKSYAIDLEILSVANHLGYKRIFEAPIKLTYVFEGLTHATGLRVIYYDDKNKRKWVYNRDLEMRVNTG